MIWHLIRRFVGFITARPLSPTQQAEISAALPHPLARLFFAQRHEDQRHAYEVSSRVQHDPYLIQAALLHDIGKAACDLGAIGRSFATIWSTTSLPVWGQWRIYTNHASIGADLLETNGADDLAITFTRLHPGPVPVGVDPTTWHKLESADDT